MCGRPPGTLLTYCRITGARSSTGISTSLTGRARRRHRAARPPAARTFRTQLHSPSIETMYHWPPTSAMTRGNRVIRPVRRPRTSSVTQRLGRRPRWNAVFQNRAYRRAVALPRPPTYIARSLSTSALSTIEPPARRCPYSAGACHGCKGRLPGPRTPLFRDLRTCTLASPTSSPTSGPCLDLLTVHWSSTPMSIAFCDTWSACRKVLFLHLITPHRRVLRPTLSIAEKMQGTPTRLLRRDQFC